MGNSFAGKGNLTSAVTEYQKTLEINPNHVLAYSGLAILHVRKGELDTAITQYQRAIEINPKFVWGHYYLAIIYAMKGETVLSITSLRAAVRLDKRMAERAKVDVGFNRVRIDPKFQALIEL